METKDYMGPLASSGAVIPALASMSNSLDRVLGMERALWRAATKPCVIRLDFEASRCHNGYGRIM